MSLVPYFISIIYLRHYSGKYCYVLFLFKHFHHLRPKYYNHSAMKNLVVKLDHFEGKSSGLIQAANDDEGKNTNIVSDAKSEELMSALKKIAIGPQLAAT